MKTKKPAALTAGPQHHDQDPSSIQRREDRDTYLDVGRYTREALEVALEKKLSGATLKVLLGIVSLLTTRSKRWDYTWYDQIATTSHVSRRSAINCIRKLSDEGIIWWQPGGPPHRLSKVGFPLSSARTSSPHSHVSSARTSSPHETTEVQDSSASGAENAPSVVKRNLHLSEGLPSYPRSSAKPSSPQDGDAVENGSRPQPPLDKCVHGKGALACIQCATQKLSDEKAVVL